MHHASLSLVLVLSATLAPARAQEPEREGAPPRPTTPVPIRPSADDAQRQMIELFGQVERELRAIDRLLQEAARPRAGAQTDGSLAERLRSAQTSGESVKAGIDRILELAASQSSSSSSSGSQSSGNPQDGQGESPLDRRGEQSTGREATPSTPQSQGEGAEPGGAEPRGPGQEPGPQGQPGQQGRDPRDSPQSSDADPDMRPGADPARGAQGGANASRDGRDRWGDLPVHAREVFRNEGGRDMPPLYRDWIDAYYRRLNREP